MTESPLFTRLAWALVHFLWQGVLLGLVAWVVLTLLRKKRPEVRYAASCLFLLGCLALPVLTLLVQGVPSGKVSMAVAATATYRGLMGFRAWFASALPLFLVLWGLGSLGLGLRALGSWLWLRRLGRQALNLLDAETRAVMDPLRQALGIRAEVRLLASPKVRGPFVHGLLNPVIFVPLGFLASMDPLALKAVLAHELAHIRRLDVLVIGLQTLIETLLYYHPVTWWLSRRVSAEREHCCDAFAVQACGDPVLFARTLSRLDALRESAAPALAGGDLMERIQRLLNLEPRGFRFPSPLLSFGLAFSASLGLAWEPASTFILRHVHPSRAEETLVQPVAREVEGLVAALREPIAPPVLAELAPVPAPEVNVLADGSTTDLTPLSLSVVSAVTLVREDPKPEPIPVERLGIPVRALFGTPVEPWPVEQEHVAEAKLPRANLFLEDVLAKPEWKPYAFTTWPHTSTHSRRLFGVEVPARSKVTFRVQGTSGGKADPYFYLSAFPWRSLVELQWIDKPIVEAPALAVVNRLDVPTRRVLVLTGPESTSYRCTRLVEPLEAGAPLHRAARMPVEGWPLPGEGMGSVTYAAAAGIPFGLVRLEFGYGIRQGTRLPPGRWVNMGGRISGSLMGDGNAEAGGSRGVTQETSVTHLRCLQVVLAAGEQARFRVEGSEGMRLELAQPLGTEAPEWIKAIENANADKPEWRERRLMIRNPTAQPQTIVLVVTSTARDAKAYRITRERLDRGELSRDGIQEVAPGQRSPVAGLRNPDAAWAAPQGRP